ncbi:BtrH N-terminal domain-containing protein [Paenibacillus thiaminolyticus]|uniref:BtrH N-terminal domain-containing protein n=1 Tax=Paenibacillus thiaminolyticus TaxID=49283 RepID=UPI0011621B79|nr:BtrH N-terminal domain-containing protein [Paenibacillus thiaminolyticus]NGP62426.1 BtrH N-terminal domain-containing protein [Paenibacillus thiaminolyticus]WCR29207.1 BtrH N-terminal domain-containing protein [Paenibacillus thiaminolyticus]
MANKHCYYYVISELCQLRNIALEQMDIFHLLGGHTFAVKKERDDPFPLLNIKGSVIDDELFRICTGLSIEKKLFINYEEALKVIMTRIGENDLQTVCTNCFFLPYDSVNYKKNIGSHFIMLRSYDPANDQFTLSDHKYDHAVLSGEDLKLAMDNVKEYKNCLLDLHIETEYSCKQMKDSVREVIKANGAKVLSTLHHQFNVLKMEIENINSLDSFYRSFSYFELLKSIKNPNGPIISKHYLVRSLPGNKPDLQNIISECIHLWERFCVDIYKNYTHDSPISLDGQLDNLYQREMDMNKQIIDVV